MRLRLAFLLPALVVTSLDARAAVYTYTDRAGVIHFTNTKDRPGAKVYDPNAADNLAFGGDVPKLANTPRMWAPLNIQKTRAAPFEPYFQQAASRYRLPAALIRAVTATESGFNPNALSHAGACGLM